MRQGSRDVNVKHLLAMYEREERIEHVWPGMRRDATPHVVRQIDIPGRDSFIIHSSLDAENVDQAIDAQIEFFKRRNQNFEWKVFNHDAPPDLKERLAARGFDIGEVEAIMVLDLQSAPEALLQPVAHDVRRITAPEGIRDVVVVQDEIWEDNRGWLGAQLIEELRRTPDHLSIYVAYVEGIPVSSAWVRFPARGRFASLWGGSTLASYRGRGLYTSLLAVRVQEARQRGTPFLTIDASPMSRPIVEKHGFQVLTFAHACKWNARPK